MEQKPHFWNKAPSNGGVPNLARYDVVIRLPANSVTDEKGNGNPAATPLVVPAHITGPLPAIHHCPTGPVSGHFFISVIFDQTVKELEPTLIVVENGTIEWYCSGEDRHPNGYQDFYGYWVTPAGHGPVTICQRARSSGCTPRPRRLSPRGRAGRWQT